MTDHGPGIPTEMQEQIFERYHRLEHGDQITSEGWGLGLYFARSLTQAQGGELTVESPVHASSKAPGATFILNLPITSEVPEDD